MLSLIPNNTIGRVLLVILVMVLALGFIFKIKSRESVTTSWSFNDVASSARVVIDAERVAANDHDTPRHHEPTDQPHIVFILADDYGFNDVGYRNPAMKTPNMDALAAAGVKLDNYYVQPICTPSRAQLMSGRSQIHTGLQHSLIWSAQPNCLPVEYPTLADKLREAGYATHMTGKWHLGAHKRSCWPTRRGFQTFLGLLHGKGDHYAHTRTWHGDPYPDDKNVTGLDFRFNTTAAPGYRGIYSTHIFTKRAEEVIANHNTEKPLFLYVAFQAVHEPLQVPKQYLDPFSEIEDIDRRDYAGMVHCMDEGVGNITRALQARGMWNNTVLIFSSDNGGSVGNGASNWPLRGAKWTLWEGGVRAVGFVSSPLLADKVKSTVSRDLIDISDWYPTLVEGAAGWSLGGSQVDGYNIWNTLRYGEPSTRIELLHNIDPDPTPLSMWKKTVHNFKTTPKFDPDTMWAALRHADWKIVITGGGYQDDKPNGWYAPPENPDLVSVGFEIPAGKTVWLFNIKNDPYETTDLSEEEPQMVKFLLHRLWSHQRGAVPIRFPDQDPESNPDLHGGVWDSWNPD